MPPATDYWERKSLDKRRAPTHPVVRAYVASRVAEIRKTVPITPDTAILDVGCGNGFFTHYLDGLAKVEGIDTSARMLELNPVKRTRLMDASAMDYPDGSFDVVFCHAVLHHVEDPAKVIAEMKRVSRRYVVVMEPNRNNPLMFLFSLVKREEHAALKFSLSFVKRQVESCGLKVIDAFSHGTFLPNATPIRLLKLLGKFDGRRALGFTNVVVAEKT